MSERTREAYLRAVRQLAQHYKKSPDLISEEELRQYFLYIKNVKKYGLGSIGDGMHWRRTPIAQCFTAAHFSYSLVVAP